MVNTINHPPIRLPLQLRALNAMGGLANVIGLGELNPSANAHMKKAEKATGLHDFGPYPIEEPLQKVIDVLHSEADLNLFGRIAAGQMVHRNLMNVLKMQEVFNSQPEVANVDVESPIIILCTPRTGSTLLHNLLALDENVRAPKMWELHRPCPPSLPASDLTDPRIKQSDREFGLYYRLVPEMKAIHFFAPEAVEECTHLFSNIFSCRLSFSTLCGRSSYTDDMWDKDMLPVYEALKQQYRILKLNYQDKLLAIKSPAHILSLDALAKAWPKAKIIHLHRDPATAAGSFCSLTEAVQISMRKNVDPLAIGKMWQDFWTPALLESVGCREENNLNILDINFKDLVKNPVATVQSIYDYFDLSVPEHLAGNIEVYLDDHPKDEYGNHEYSLKRYGLDRKELYSAYANYIQKFNVPLES